MCKDGYKLFVIKARKLVKQDPSKSKAYYMYARKLGYDSAYYDTAEAYFSIQDYESAFKEIESGIKNKESKCTKAYQLFSKTASDYLKANKIQEAIDLYLKMIKIGDKEHYYELAKAYLDIGQEKSAYEALKKGKQNKDSRCLKKDLFLEKEKENEEAGKFQNACNCYLYAIELGDNSCYYELASLYLKYGQIEEAKSQFEKAKQAKDPRCKSYLLFTDYGFDMIRKGKTEQAILAFDAVRLLGCKDYNLTLATCYLEQGEIDSVIKIAGLLEKQEENVAICEKFIAKAKTLHDQGQLDDAIKLLSCVLDKGCCFPARITYFEYQVEKGNTAIGLKTLRKFSKFDSECSKALHDYYRTHFKNFSLPDMYHWCRNEKSDLDYSKCSYQDVLDYIEDDMNNHDSKDVFVRNTFLILSGSKEDKEKLKTMLSQQASESDNLSSVYAGYLLLKYYNSKEFGDKFIISISKKIIKQFKDEMNETELSMIFGNDKAKAELFPVYLNSMLRNKINPKNGKEQLWNFPSSIEKSRFEHDIDVICQFREKHASLAGLAYDFFSELVKNGCYSYCLHLALLCDIETNEGREAFKENANSFLKNSCNRDNTLANICLARRYAKFDMAKALKLYDKVFNASYLNHEPVKQIASEAFNICTGFFDKLKWGRRVKIVFN